MQTTPVELENQAEVLADAANHTDAASDAAATNHPDAARDTEAGDVPGWVLVTLMTAGLVTVVWALADQALRDWFTQAINSVIAP